MTLKSPHFIQSLQAAKAVTFQVDCGHFMFNLSSEYSEDLCSSLIKVPKDSKT